MDEREKLIKKLIKEKGGSREDYLNLLNSIAYHESAHTMDPTIKQIGGGPGRGKYQFEEGRNAGGITAARRTVKYYKDQGMKVPDWLQKATQGDSLDATKLTSEQQDVLYLGNMRNHPKANFKNVWDGKESVTDFWAKYHWAGKDEDKAARVKSFNSSLNSLKKNSNDITPSQEIERRSILPINAPVREMVVDNTSTDRPSFKPEDLYNPLEGSTSRDGSLANLRQYMQQANLLAMGGHTNTRVNSADLNVFNVGGTHEQNPHGGIPQGIGSNGNINTVEQDETSFKLEGIGKFIFSNRIKI